MITTAYFSATPDPQKPRLSEIRLLAMDVDGVLTDGTLAYEDSGSESKRFHVADGLGLTALRLSGYEIAWISGRRSPATERRAAELKIAHPLVGAADKFAALTELTRRLKLPAAQVAYIGDDWNDLLAFEAAGIRIAVANAVQEVKQRAHWITELSGGQGAVREVCNALLDGAGKRNTALETYLASLRGAMEHRNAQ